MTTRVAVVDYGMGNLQSVVQALRAAAPEGTEVVRTHSPEEVRTADRLVVPGQGGFRDAAARLAQDGLGESIREKMLAGAPYLGICLGLQILFESSEEAPGAVGFGWFKGAVKKLNGGEGIKIPHMGWNGLTLASGGHPLLEAAGGPDTYVYFVHSFHAVPTEADVVRATVQHGDNVVTAAVGRDNVVATQFHPEKSQGAGIALLRRFLTS
ncbi:MAG: imidazole glycerol phosphate synthase subunit HisH [Myxococcales bacterium]|nr:MAG: imidazole glycerol phosphate synthase subunit HisH [Myxococcales bacterium]